MSPNSKRNIILCLRQDQDVCSGIHTPFSCHDRHFFNLWYDTPGTSLFINYDFGPILESWPFLRKDLNKVWWICKCQVENLCLGDLIKMFCTVYFQIRPSSRSVFRTSLPSLHRILPYRETWQLGSVSSTDQVGNECGFEIVGSRTLKVMTSWEKVTFDRIEFFIRNMQHTWKPQKFRFQVRRTILYI